MQCSRWDELMSLHLDGALSPDQQQQLQAHLADCQACREQWTLVSWLSARLKAEPPAAPAPHFAARVTARLEQRETRRRRLYSTIGICIASVGLWTAAALGVLVLFAVLSEPALQAVLVDMGVSLLQSVLAVVSVLGKAVWAITYALATRPTGLLLVGYALLALTLAAFWTRALFRRWGYAAQ